MLVAKLIISSDTLMVLDITGVTTSVTVEITSPPTAVSAVFPIASPTLAPLSTFPAAFNTVAVTAFCPAVRTDDPPAVTTSAATSNLLSTTKSRT